MTRVTNFQRAHWASVALEAFREQVGRDDDQTSVQDLITDLGHYCRLNRLNFADIAAKAISCWCAECADPDGFKLDPGPNVSIIIAGRKHPSRTWRQSGSTARPGKRRGGAP